MTQGWPSATRPFAFETPHIFMGLTATYILAAGILHPRNLEIAKTSIYEECTRCIMAYATVMGVNYNLLVLRGLYKTTQGRLSAIRPIAFGPPHLYGAD